MGDVLDVLSSVVLVAAALLAAIAALGVVRFRKVLTRMHAVTKASTGAITHVFCCSSCSSCPPDQPE